MVANERQVGGDHYQTASGLQHWDVVVHFDLDYFQGQITRYLFRWREKGGIQDLEKAMHFMEKYLEVERLKEIDKALGGDGSVSVVRTEVAGGKGIPRQKIRPARKR